uniref:Putative secreted peptide n=1 Tax=Anopheles braziliensis TaxID=58242 RepID=A0A2M3ZVQ8_9DIPT
MSGLFSTAWIRAMVPQALWMYCRVKNSSLGYVPSAAPVCSSSFGLSSSGASLQGNRKINDFTGFGTISSSSSSMPKMSTMLQSGETPSFAI